MQGHSPAREREILRARQRAAALYGTANDATIAQRVGVHVSTIRRWRARAGVPAHALTDWSRVDFHARTDAEIAADSGRKLSTVMRARVRHGVYRERHQSPQAWDESTALGVLPDAVVAHLHRTCISAVAGARRRRNVLAPTLTTSVVPVTVEITSKLRARYPGVDLHVAIFLEIARSTGAHDIDRP